MLPRIVLASRFRVALMVVALALLPFEGLAPLVTLPGMSISNLELALVLAVAAWLLFPLSGPLSRWERVRVRASPP